MASGDGLAYDASRIEELKDENSSTIIDNIETNLSTKQATSVTDSPSVISVNSDLDTKNSSETVPAATEELNGSIEYSVNEPTSQIDEDTGVKAAVEEQKENDGLIDGWMDVLGNGQLMKKIIRKGEGVMSRPDRGSEVTVTYSMKLENGEFLEKKTNQTFTVGDADVVQGLDLALPLMELHEVAELSVGARFGFGTLGREPDIPGEARLLFEIELHDVQPPLEPESMPMAERLRRGNEKREMGNWWYTRNDVTQAIQCYRRSLDFIDDEEATFQGNETELQQALDMRLKVYNNLAAAQLKMEVHDAALKSVENVLRLQPNNVKALFRKSKILSTKGQTEDAITCLRKAMRNDPDNKTLQQELNKLNSRYKSEVQSERDMYKRMLGNKQEQQRSQQNKNSASTWSLIAGGVAAVLVGIVAFKQYHA